MHTNLAGFILEHATKTPDRLALVIPTSFTETVVEEEATLTFGELGERVARLRGGLAASGLGVGDRVVVMFPVSLELYALVVALLASAMVPVFIDTSMGKKRVLTALKRARPKAIVSVKPLLRHWPWLPALWGLRRYWTDQPGWGTQAFESLNGTDPVTGGALDVPFDSTGLVTFTSGTTGMPKGANRTHDILVAQHLALSEHFPASDDEIDMPCFPVVTLHNLCCGITTVMPAVDLSNPAAVEPAVVASQIETHRITRMTGAPAYLWRLADHIVEAGRDTSSVRALGAGAAPVSPSLCARVIEAFPSSENLVIYGSTEAEPMASLPMQDVVAAPRLGYLVGWPAEVATIVPVRLPEPMVALDEREMEPFRVSDGEVGELVVKGPHVLRAYLDDPAANQQTKIPSPSGGVWHRTGDVGRFDEQGRLWLLGRASAVCLVGEREVYPFEVEVLVNEIEGVGRTVLLGHDGVREPEVLIQLTAGASREGVRAEVEDALRRLDLEGLPVDFVSSVPMDARHGSKIDRPRLRALREGQ